MEWIISVACQTCLFSFKSHETSGSYSNSIVSFPANQSICILNVMSRSQSFLLILTKHPSAPTSYFVNMQTATTCSPSMAFLLRLSACLLVISDVNCACSSPFSKIKSVCVLIRMADFTWCEGQRFCRQNGGELLTGHTALRALKDKILPRRGHREYFWIGATDMADERKRSRSGWRWTNGSLVPKTIFKRQNKKIPVGDPGYDCLEIEDNWAYNYNCDNSRIRVICQPLDVISSTKSPNYYRTRVFAFSDPDMYAKGACVKSLKVESHIDCARLCWLEESVCVSFYFNNKHFHCRLVLYTDATLDVGDTDGWEKFNQQN